MTSGAHTLYKGRKDEDSARMGETVVVKKLLGSSLDFIDAFAKEARLFGTTSSTTT